MKVQNPATHETLAELASDSGPDLARKLALARAAQPGWAATSLGDRLAIVARFRDALAARKPELARILTREMGKPIRQAENEIGAMTQSMTGRIDFFLGATAEALKPTTVLDDAGMEETITHEPLGVVANVSAWNYPYFVGSNVFIPALLTGNAVLYKPSELTSMTGLAIAELLHGAGVPSEIFAPVIGTGAVGDALVRLDVDGVFFTGSHPTGKKIAEALAGRFIRTQFELGGKDPTYVCDDVASVSAAAEGLADGAFYNTGQSCCSVERIYVHQKVARAFIEAFLENVRGFRLGDPEDPATYIGPLARAPQLGVLEAQVRDAVARGARLLCGGQRSARPGNYFEPTVLTEVTTDMAVMREESFGPIIGIEVVPDDEAAIARMNDTEYGLTAGVYSSDRERARRILSRVDAGSVYWNCCDRVSPRLPWTGRKHSGMGSTLSTAGITAFLQPKAWHLRRV
jgi:acyl-CoA reductase-like NAD-dependent aldehyde dehydrogenase